MYRTEPSDLNDWLGGAVDKILVEILIQATSHCSIGLITLREMDRQADGWTDGWTDRHTYRCINIQTHKYLMGLDPHALNLQQVYILFIERLFQLTRLKSVEQRRVVKAVIERP